MRKIRAIIDFFARLILQKEQAYDADSDPPASAETQALHLRLQALPAAGDINEAENLLFERYCPGDRGFLLLALDFYRRQNEQSDEALICGGFSRGEVEEGLRAILQQGILTRCCSRLGKRACPLPFLLFGQEYRMNR